MCIRERGYTVNLNVVEVEFKIIFSTLQQETKKVNISLQHFPLLFFINLICTKIPYHIKIEKKARNCLTKKTCGQNLPTILL